MGGDLDRPAVDVVLAALIIGRLIDERAVIDDDLTVSILRGRLLILDDVLANDAPIVVDRDLFEKRRITVEVGVGKVAGS